MSANGHPACGSLTCDAVHAISMGWQAAFNAGNAQQAASFYEPNATMVAQPVGKFTGRDEIQAFWTKILNDGFTKIAYNGTRCKQVSDTEVVLSSNWTMNKAWGIITGERWVLQEDGSARLRLDEFAILG